MAAETLMAMPFAENQGVRIYWDEQGEGPPLVLIMGLGCSADVWRRLRASVSRSYRTIALDNRCAGRSGVGRCTMALMAADVAAVMDAAGIGKAHILGASMGGMIAQEFALRYPQRVRSLILACTTPGGIYALQAKIDLLPAVLLGALRAPATAMDSFIPFLYHPSTPREMVAEEMTTLKRWAPSRAGLLAQVLAILAWRSYDRLPTIAAPTLVIYGDADRLVPPQNSQLIASRIPGAQLVMIPGAGHMLATDQPELSSRAVSEFLRGVEQAEGELESPARAGPL